MVVMIMKTAFRALPFLWSGGVGQYITRKLLKTGRNHLSALSNTKINVLIVTTASTVPWKMLIVQDNDTKNLMSFSTVHHSIEIFHNQL
jgi:hypothetical protein